VDDDKLERLRNGDHGLFAELVRDHQRLLISVATPIVGASEAEEVVQNAWYKAYKSIHSFEGRSAVRTWLARIVINEARMQRRSRRRESLFSEAGDDTPDDVLSERFGARGQWRKPPARWHLDSPEAVLTGDKLRECLERLLAEMPEGQRALLEMRDASGMDFDEICNELSVSSSNARVLLHRARTRLFALVDHYQETGEC